MVQTANRIAATHRGTVPEVSFWISQDIWDAIGCHDRLAQEARQVAELQCHSKLSHPSRAPKQDHLVRCCRRLLGHHSPLTYQSRPVAPVILAVTQQSDNDCFHVEPEQGSLVKLQDSVGGYDTTSVVLGMEGSHMQLQKLCNGETMSVQGLVTSLH